jgi:hypothetical protein
MLVVTVELLPGGAEFLRRSIATTRISNEGDLPDMSTYRVTAMEPTRRLTGSPADIAHMRFADHSRRQRVSAPIQRVCEEIKKADWVEF